LRIGSEQQQRRGSDAGVRAVPARIGTVAREVFGRDHRGGEVELHAAVALRRQDGGQPEFRRFPQHSDRDVVIAVVDRFEIRRDFLVPELVGRSRDRAMLVGQIFGSEDLLRCPLFNEKGAAFGFR
jgi:hypothetical protein